MARDDHRSGTAQTWSVTYPAGSLRGLADGALTVQLPSYIEDGSVLAGVSAASARTPWPRQDPRIRPRGGTFLRSKSVRLGSPGAREIWYTLSGTRPGRNRGVEYHGEFQPHPQRDPEGHCV